MNRILTSIITIAFATLFLTGAALAGSDMKGHDMSSSDKIGTLFHESTVDGYMLSYYLLDLRDPKGDAKDAAHAKKDMDKPHHIMVYIMDKTHAPVLEGKVGFVIKDDQGNPQKTMAMFMSKGFGITADMKKKGIYTITAKAILGDVKLMDSFTHEMK
ncbi:MAG: hypothetical protein KKF12_20210 [Proteobacteria bacterium]|nr:hypothetical protein [Desulfobacula sp.]MBU3953739.1 hypothetical protein [Pseudomonadota bacterium]MBU4133151.1 hypothetical protein [Pseudomonadota bacterium]